MLQNQLFKLAARLAKPSASRVVGSISNAIRYQQGPSFSSLLSSRQPALFSAPALARSFKIKTAVKKMCPDCYLVRRKGRLWVYCRSNPKHKQKQA